MNDLAMFVLPVLFGWGFAKWDEWSGRRLGFWSMITLIVLYGGLLWLKS